MKSEPTEQMWTFLSMAIIVCSTLVAMVYITSDNDLTDAIQECKSMLGYKFSTEPTAPELVEKCLTQAFYTYQHKKSLDTNPQ